MPKTIIGVMGPGETASGIDRENAYNLGGLIANQGWLLLTGGRNCGVMEAASRGAKSQGGLVIGILPTADLEAVSTAVDIAIATGMNQARNNINVLSSQVVIACGMGLGTASEVALALKNGKSVILLSSDSTAYDFFVSFAPNHLLRVETPSAAIAQVQQLLRI